MPGSGSSQVAATCHLITASIRPGLPEWRGLLYSPAMIVRLVLLFALLPAAAQAERFICEGQEPRWTLEFDEATGRFGFPADTEMEVMNDIPAEGADWPRAFTLIGNRDTAIVLLERETCGEAPLRAHILTQRGQTPILLTGCCQVAE